MIFFGTKVVQNKLPSERKVCPTCMSVTEHDVVDVDTRFTLYFIPLFSVKREAIYRCLTCGDAHTVPYEEYEGRQEEAAVPDIKWKIDTPEDEPDAGNKNKTKKEKARVILEGKVVNGKAENLRVPLNLESLPILRYLWIGFGLVALLAIGILILVFRLLAR
ncbi:MAG: zinc-ribbon domain-containing protein [Chloroflexi bacterium]|nr:zinc-ribbon domain-containing protein [Chloroflexota bacterium]